MESSKYKNSKVYKIIDNTENQFYYIGSTRTTLAKRLWKHKQHAKEHPEQKIYKYFNSINWNVRIILINEFNLQNNDQLRREEDNVIKNCLQDSKCLNTHRAYTTNEEKSLYHNAYNKDYEKISKIIEYRNKYRLEHKNEKSEYDQKYRELTKEKRNKRDKTLETCGCGAITQHGNLTHHFHTKKHQTWLSTTKDDQIVNKHN